MKFDFDDKTGMFVISELTYAEYCDIINCVQFARDHGMKLYSQSWDEKQTS